MNSRISDRPFCQVAGCHRRAAQWWMIDLPAAWEATASFTTVNVVAGLCDKHGHDVSARVQAMLQARTEFHDLLSIIEQAVRFEKAQQLRLDAATDQADRHELENGGLRQQLQDAEAALRLADPCLVCGGDHDRISREDCPHLAVPGRLGGAA